MCENPDAIREFLDSASSSQGASAAAAAFKPANDPSLTCAGCRTVITGEMIPRLLVTGQSITNAGALHRSIVGPPDELISRQLCDDCGSIEQQFARNLVSVLACVPGDTILFVLSRVFCAAG